LTRSRRAAHVAQGLGGSAFLSCDRRFLGGL
jgi:hypothetical protein